MLWMSEAHAKMHLREYVTKQDVDIAIWMLLESFLQSQKSSIAAELRPKFAKYLTKMEDDYTFLFHSIKNLYNWSLNSNKQRGINETIEISKNYFAD